MAFAYTVLSRRIARTLVGAIEPLTEGTPYQMDDERFEQFWLDCGVGITASMTPVISEMVVALTKKLPQSFGTPADAEAYLMSPALEEMLLDSEGTFRANFIAALTKDKKGRKRR